MNPRSRVYFIKPAGSDGPIKIGCSGLPDGRLKLLAVWSPLPLELIGSVPGSHGDEFFLHSCFADNHSHYEWFHWTPQLGDAIKQILKAGSVDVVRSQLIPVRSLRAAHLRGPDVQRCCSYKMRVYWAERRERAKDENGAWNAPPHIDEILARWAGHGGVPRITPTPEELARLNEFLADPAQHCVIPSWRRKVAA